MNDFKASLIVFLQWEQGLGEVGLISHTYIGNITITAQKRAESGKKTPR